MLQTIKGIKAFDTLAAFTGNRKAVVRFVTSIAFLNILPFAHFSIILLYLLQYLELTIYSVLMIFSLSISIFGFDKIFHSILVRHATALYTEPELASISSNDNIKKKFSYHYFQFLVPGALYVAIPIGLLAIVFNAGIGLSVIVISGIGTVAAWYRWRAVLRSNKAVTINQEK